MKFKLGDKVMVVSDLTEDKDYSMLDGSSLDSVTGDMLRFASKTVTITLSANNSSEYGIEEDGGVWCWTDEMFVEGQAE